MSPISPLASNYSVTTYQAVLAEDDGVTRILALFYTALLAIGVIYQIIKWSINPTHDTKNFAASEIVSNRALHRSKSLIARFSFTENKSYRSKLASIWQSTISTLMHNLHAARETTDPWKDPVVLRAANQAIQIAYALGHDILSDLNPSSLKASAQYKSTFALEYLFYLPVTYHMARWCATTKEAYSDETEEGTKGSFTSSIKAGFYREENEIPAHHIYRFYYPGTYNEWRILFNRYAQEVKSCIPETTLKALDNRLFNWLQEDSDRKTFAYSHDTLPGCSLLYVPATPILEL